MIIVGRLGIAFVVLIAVLVGIGVVARYVSDGPIGPIPGGLLRSGSLASERDIDWSFAEHIDQVELQLVEPPGSRTTGILVHEGQLYVPCDLGFIWRRAPAPARWMLFMISRFKRWHEDAVRDGRVVLRIAGKRYERQAVRVTEPQLLVVLRSLTTEKAELFFSSPLTQATPNPDAIWFFRMEPRPPTGVPRAEETARGVSR